MYTWGLPRPPVRHRPGTLLPYICRMEHFCREAMPGKYKKAPDFSGALAGRANGIRTRVAAVKGRCPNP